MLKLLSKELWHLIYEILLVIAFWPSRKRMDATHNIEPFYVISVLIAYENSDD